MSTRALAAAALTLNAFVWGVSWWPFRALQSHGLHPLWATAIIYALVASGLANVGFNWAVTVGDVVRVVLLFYLMPAWVVLLAWPLLGEKPSTGSVLRLVMALTGVVIVLQTPTSFTSSLGSWPLPESLADWLALMAGFSFALTNILLRKLNQTPSESRTLAMFGGGAVMATAAAVIGMGLGIVTMPPAPAAGWVGLTLLVSLAFLAGNLALQYGAARLSASATSLIMLSEVVFASVSSVMLGAGELSTRTWLGGGLILLASLLAVGPFSER